MSLSSSKSTYKDKIKNDIYNGIKSLQGNNQNDQDSQLQAFADKIATAVMNNVNDWLQAAKKPVAVDPTSHTEPGTQSGVNF